MLFLSAVSKQLNPPTVTWARVVVFATQTIYIILLEVAAKFEWKILLNI